MNRSSNRFRSFQRRQARRDARKQRLRRRQGLGLLTVLAASITITPNSAFGDGVGLVLNSKSLPDATVAVIDPESGTSSGGTGSDVNLAVGDIILFRFAMAPVPNAALHGQAGYLTEYVPSGLDVVGVRYIDENGVTIKPNRAGLARDGCHSNNTCEFGSGTTLDCSAGRCVLAAPDSLPEGSLAQLVADTGVFFSTDARTARTPNDEFITTNNGIDMATALPVDIARINGLIGDDSAPFFAHNEWDWIQVQAFGPEGGNTPHLVGSAVAGPETHYGFEVTDVGGGALEFNDVTGPWERIAYPGSQTGTGSGFAEGVFGSGTLEEGRPNVESFEGWDVTPAAADVGARTGRVEGANAIRFALGEIRTGRPLFAEVAFRVNAVPFDPIFEDPLLGTGGNINCAEVFGSDLSGNIPQDGRGQNNLWALYMGSPTCVFLRNKFDLNVDKDIAINGDALEYTLSGSNLALSDETGVTACIKYDSAGLSHDAQAGETVPDSTTCSAAACGDTSALGACLIYNFGTLAPGDDYEVQASFLINGGNGKDAITTQAVYSSNELPIDTNTLIGGFSTQALSIVTAVPLPKIVATPTFNQTAAFASAGGTFSVSGTLSNEGTRAYGPQDFLIHLPTGWRVASSDEDATPDVTIDGTLMECDSGCATENPIFGFPGSGDDVEPAGAVGDSQTIAFDVEVAAGEATGLYPVGLAVNASATSFGPNFETFFPEALTVNVGALRSVPPVLDCPIGSTSTGIDGTTSEADGTTVRAYFNLIERGDGTSTGGDWTVNNFGAFGGMYGGLEVRATAQATGELESELSTPCEVTPKRECSDGLDNDGDGNIDFPADLGCDSPSDNDETDPPANECADGIDNDGDGFADFAGTDNSAADPNLEPDSGCQGPDDNSEDNNTACNDGVDNDFDGLVDFPDDPGCDSANDANEIELAACQDSIDNDGDGSADFAGIDLDDNGTIDIPPDPGCFSAFDNDETDEVASADIKARLLVIMDTSGSMNFNTCNDTFTGGDGSFECPGTDIGIDVCDDGAPGVNPGETASNGQPDDSRLAKVKDGISNVVAGFGEVEFGLMRFSQRDENFQCPTVFAAQQSGGWQGGGAEPCGGGFNGGELLVDFHPENQDEILGWMDGESNYPAFDPQVVPAGMDRELRGSGTTPIAGALDSAQSYLFNTESIDPVGACRPYTVILVTDGSETCGGDPVAEAEQLRLAGYDVFVIGFATSDPNIVADLDAIAFAGQDPSENATAIVVNDAAALSQAIADIISETVLVESCNGIDDDCDCPGDTNSDGTVCGPGDLGVDEGFPGLGDTCNNGETGVCFEAGDIVCTNDGQGTTCNAPDGTPQTEECNGIDDDCDLIVDEDFQEECSCAPGLEICNGIDDDCDCPGDTNMDGEICGEGDEGVDEGDLPGVGEACGFDVGECTPGTLSCVNGDFVCSGTEPGVEATLDDCDGLDNDCDTVTDEVTVACYDPNDDGTDGGAGDVGCDLATGNCVGTCQTGLRSCVQPAPNGGDITECVGDIGPIVELCNGQDDDCDGAVDEDFPVGDVCDNGQLGECFLAGTFVCDPNDVDGDGDGVSCTAFPIQPGTEVCDGLDNDCDCPGDTNNDGTICGPGDTNVDEDPLPAPIGNACGGTGTSCGQGVVECVNGAPECTGEQGGDDETCNGQDDDCDTVVDEDSLLEPLQGIGETCYPFASGCDVNTGVCAGSCDLGSTICVAGSAVCDGATGPAAEETCNGEDDDCDGEVDEAATCPVEDDICLEGNCVSPCVAGEFPCPLGYFCQDFDPEGDFCVPDPCEDISCEAGELCDSDLGACVDPCEGNDCPTGSLCFLGGCYDCFDAGFACPEGEVCAIGENPGIGECEEDPCYFTQCDDDQFCSNGDCIDLTCDPACGQGERCDNGTCVDDPCEGVDCGLDICDPESGECVDNPCEGRFCPDGTICVPSSGTCENDPCTGLSCPDPLVCEVDFNGDGQCVSSVAEPDGDWVSVGGGGGCSTGGRESSQSAAWLLLALGALMWRRRREDA